MRRTCDSMCIDYLEFEKEKHKSPNYIIKYYFII